MKFNLDILKRHLLIRYGIPPERVNLESLCFRRMPSQLTKNDPY